MATPPLDGTYRVVDLSAGIAGAYATKILAEAGAEVVMIEPPGGSALRRRSASGHDTDPTYGGVLFQFLAANKASVVADPDGEADLSLMRQLVAGADAVLWSWESVLCRQPELAPEALQALAPHAVIVAITPYGLRTSWNGRAANEFTLQAVSGTAWNHGSSEGPPLMVGGNAGDYAIGTAAALAMLVSRYRARATGKGELIDLAAIEVLHLTHIMFPITFRDMTGRPYRSERRDSSPTAHKCRDGWVGIWVTSGQQWLDFCTMIGRQDWLDDPSLGSMDVRALRAKEIIPAMDAWMAERTVEEVIDLGTALRVPVAPIGRGDTLTTFDHFVERGFYVPNPRTGVPQPDVWYHMSDAAFGVRREPSPALGADTDRFRAATLAPLLTVEPPGPDFDRTLPLKGLRIADMTAYWAGPIIPHLLAFLGADVIHIESAKRPDGIRMAAIRPMSEDGWWETSPFFTGTNTNKRDLAVDLQVPAGRDAMLRVIETCDALVENFSPRVMGQLGLDYDDLRAHRDDVIMVRAPAFGIKGPWTHRVGYAPTIDQASGLAWITGYPGERPKMVGAASDAVGGMHGTISLLLALEHRRRTGQGNLVESPQIGPGLNVTAEQVLEFHAHGVLLGPVGNRAWTMAPQGVYRATDVDRSGSGEPSDDWVAISVENDDQWHRLCAAIGLTELAADPILDTVEGRRAAHDRIDDAISAYCRTRSAHDVAALLSTSGIPASAVFTPHELADIEPVVERGFYEWVHNPIAGSMRVPGFPVGMEFRPKLWNRTPAPLMGEHNRAILQDLGGYDLAAIDQLEADNVIGYSTTTNLGW